MQHPPNGASLTERLAELLGRPISHRDRQRAVLHLIDWLGCAIAGRRTETSLALAPGTFGRLAANDVPDPHCDAALAFDLGGLGSILEMDDVDRRGLLHPGPVVAASVIAVARGRNGHAVLDAMVRGYDAMIRLGRAVGAGHYAYFHNTSTTGGFGAAVAAGSLANLPEPELVWAMGNAASVSGGLWQCRHEDVMTKPFHCAEAARRGTMAALLARGGLTGPRAILEGPQGLFAAMCPDGDPANVLVYSDEWLIHEVSFKPWPACRHAHAAIDAALALRERAGADVVTGIEVETYADAIAFCDRAAPRSEGAAKFSLQHAVAIALYDGPPRLAAFAAENLDRREIATLRGMTVVKAADEFTTAYPRHFGARVTVLCRGGERLSRTVADAWGDSENPMSDEAVFAKFRALCAHSNLRSGDCEALASAASALIDDAPIEPLLTALSKSLQAT